MRLFSSFRTALHPLSLCHDGDLCIVISDHNFRDFFDFDYFFSPVLGEEYAYRSTTEDEHDANSAMHGTSVHQNMDPH
jgi:hypothetical protein